MNKKLKILHILLTSAILFVLGLMSFRIYSLRQNIHTLQEEINSPNKSNLDTEISESPEDWDICTITVMELKDIKPIEGCWESDITLENFYLDGMEITIQAIFYLVNDNNFYSLELYLDDTKVDDPLFEAWSSLRENNMTSIWGTTSSRFLKINEEGETKLLGIFSTVAAQCNDEYLLILNKEGDVLFSEEWVHIINFEIDEEEIDDTFTIYRSVYGACLGVQCNNPDAEEGTVVEETETYEVKNGLVKLTETKTITYGDYCSD